MMKTITTVYSTTKEQRTLQLTWQICCLGGFKVSQDGGLLIQSCLAYFMIAWCSLVITNFGISKNR